MTKIDYSKLSDQEINMLVAKIQHPDKNFIESKTRPPSVVLLNHINNWVDYCNNPADAWPIIESKLICLAADVFAEPHDGGKWVAQPAYGWEKERVRSDNPLRAAMIVFLEMQK